MSQATQPLDANTPLVDMRGLRVTFTGSAKPVHAVSDVSLQLHRGEVLALIGESGSGKSVTLRALLRLHSEGRTQIDGRIVVAGQDLVRMSQAELSQYRGAVASMIFQEPLLALDPVYTLEQQIIESIRRHEPVSSEQALARALELFEQVRIPSPERRLQSYPHDPRAAPSLYAGAPDQPRAWRDAQRSASDHDPRSPARSQRAYSRMLIRAPLCNSSAQVPPRAAARIQVRRTPPRALRPPSIKR